MRGLFDKKEPTGGGFQFIQIPARYLDWRRFLRVQAHRYALGPWFGLSLATPWKVLTQSP